MRSEKNQKLEKPPLRLLLWTALAALLFGLLGVGELPEDMLRTARNGLHPHKASGDIVLVEIDDAALREVGRWPWPRSYHAKLTDQLTDAGAKRIFFDILFLGEGLPEDDRAFASSIERSGRVVLPVMPRFGPDKGEAQDNFPIPELRQHAQLGTVSASYNYQNAIWRLPFAQEVKGDWIPSYASLLAGRSPENGTSFLSDYSIDPASIPTVQASAVISGKFDPKQFAGKEVIIGATAQAVGDIYFIPGTGNMGGAYVQIIGAETLKQGNPLYVGWIPFYLVAIVIAAFAATRRRRTEQYLLLVGSALALLVGPAALEANLVFADVTPAVVVVGIISTVLTWRGYRQRGLTHAVSSLPNLTALRINKAARKRSIVVARILNYDEIVATLPASAEQQFVDQIVARLSVGASGKIIYQGDGGIFAWAEAPGAAFGNHLDALSALFRNPARLGGQSLDLSVAFGVELGSGRSVANRLASAAVAADLAASHGLKWKYHDPQSLQDASWRLSMMSQLDDAIDRGEVWVAYQPKLDLRTRQIVGAEALARWTHPEKGPIAASEFVAAAEQHDRIGKLTDFVFEQAIASAAAIHRRQPTFEMAVNLSARLLGDRQLPLRLRAMLARHGLPPANLVLELTETAELGSDGVKIERLVALRDLGLTISIDDYGTGLSTLDYLKKVPASEIKIDQSFIKGMVDNRSDRLMVQSTIALAHSLGRRVVAEGVEHRETLEALTELDCDIAQGFIIGRPMSIESLIKRLCAPRKGQVA